MGGSKDSDEILGDCGSVCASGAVYGGDGWGGVGGNCEEA